MICGPVAMTTQTASNSRAFVKWTCLMIAAYPLCLGCGRPGMTIANYKRAMASGFQQVPEARQIEEFYGEADHTISHSGDFGPRQKWTSNVYLHGRYWLAMQVDVRLNWSSSGVEEVIGEPLFRLCEIDKIEHYANGGVGASFNGRAEVKFGKAEWAKVVAAKGDLSVLGIRIVKDDPIPDVDAYIHAKRKDIYQDWR